jgi:hypothetical protein
MTREKLNSEQNVQECDLALPKRLREGAAQRKQNRITEAWQQKIASAYFVTRQKR